MTEDFSFPTSIHQIDNWSRETAVSTQEARIRFASYAILECIALYPPTQNTFVLKGGNALRYIYQSQRSTKDLDFTADTADDGNALDSEKAIRSLLNIALEKSKSRFNLKTKCQRVKRRPKRPDATKPTYDVGVGYLFPDDKHFLNFETINVPTVIPVEISLNDLICESIESTMVNGLRVCSLEDIIAEKLRSLLQQKTRDRYRWQDVYDISHLVAKEKFSREKIADFLKQKSQFRAIDVKKSAFDDDIKKRALREYDDRVRSQAPQNIIPFEKAWAAVVGLVASLEIPD